MAEIEAQVKQLNEKYNIKEFPSTLSMGTLDKFENEAAAALVEYWKNKGKITPILAEDLFGIIENDIKIYKQISKELEIEAENKLNNEPLYKRILYLSSNLRKKEKNRIIRDLEDTKEVSYNPILKVPPPLWEGLLEAYEGDLSNKGYIDLITTDEGRFLVPTEKLLDSISLYIGNAWN